MNPMNRSADRNIRVRQFFDRTDNYLAKNFDIRLRCRIVRELAGVCCQEKILDLGSGDGSLSMQYQCGDNKITLVDISENMLSIAKRRLLPEAASKVRFIHSSIEDFCTSEKYKLILGIGILAHAGSIEGTLQKISSLLRDDGRCIIQITDSAQLFSRLLWKYNNTLDSIFNRHGYKRNAMSLSEISEICRDNDLNVATNLRYSLIFPGMISLTPNETLYKYHEMIYKNKRLAKFGSECMIKLVKTKS